MRFLHCVLVWSCAATTLCGCGNPESPSPAPGENNQCQSAELNPDNIILLDVRSADEYASGHLQGARNIPHDRIAEEIAAVVPDKTAKIILYCRSGRRAGTALKTLNSMGYENALNLGGLEDAQERLGLPVVKE